MLVRCQGNYFPVEGTQKFIQKTIHLRLNQNLPLLLFLVINVLLQIFECQVRTTQDVYEEVVRQETDRMVDW